MFRVIVGNVRAVETRHETASATNNVIVTASTSRAERLVREFGSTPAPLQSKIAGEMVFDTGR